MQQNVAGTWHGVQSGHNITKHRGQVVVSWNQTSQVSVKSLELDDSHETISNQQTLLRGLLCHEKLLKTLLKRCS